MTLFRMRFFLFLLQDRIEYLQQIAETAFPATTQY